MAPRPTSSDAVRRTLRKSGDPRVSRTRSGILDAVRTLSEAGDDLSVSAVVRTAGISRASFYAHYASLDDLAAALRRDAFLAIGDLYRVDRHETPDALRLSQERLVAHVSEHRALYAAVAALPVSKESYLADVREMAAVIEPTLTDHPHRPADMQPATIARYVAGAAYGVLDAWTAGELELTDAELVDHLTRLLPHWYSSDGLPTVPKRGTP
ncbi:TetR/AcrR family transcriptional regulator [Patulibacter sp. S7RM1-6]